MDVVLILIRYRTREHGQLETDVVLSHMFSVHQRDEISDPNPKLQDTSARTKVHSRDADEVA
jgi:hypothetical protein